MDFGARVHVEEAASLRVVFGKSYLSLIGPGCGRDVDLCEKIKVPAIFSSPYDFGLGCTIIFLYHL